MRKESFPTSRYKLRMAANKIRKLAGVSDDEPFPVVKFLETILLAEGWQFDIVPDDEMPEKYAETIPNEKKFRIRESVYEDAIKDYPRHRFTVAHEIGHLLFHDNLTVSLARNEEPIPKYKDPEWQANTFAAELLVPFNKIRRMSVNEISQKYRVSKKVAQIQASYLSKIPA